ncbi:LysM domain-containing protein [Pseudarthrobacter sp. NamB4]|uniref:LysM peptidoglycan-binding domain-containing protein n=1 Tax=Pseudarthrobacter sp. NamB4 TaxID=2576837 RepID=UPI0010FF1E82|nr:LysM domain-containing protein [Pseudarthrobacter sp. NamB4]TLM74609.1 LysM peptidoglycan-binding domain-containing protein [Pseudarthrobacter sp. NamB4]
MNQPHLDSPEASSRSFATDEPRRDLAAGKPVISNRLWAGMATAAVVAAVGVGALAAPPASVTYGTTAAGQVAGTAAPAEPGAASAPEGEPAPPPPAVPGAEAPGAAAPAAAVPDAAVPAPEAPAAPAPTPPAPEVVAEPVNAPAFDPNLYTVVPGDTVGAIAARHGVDMNAMLAANGLGHYSIIVPGQTLLMTGPPVAAPAAASPAPAPASAPAAAPVPAPAPIPAPAPVQAAPAVRTIYVAGAGGQAMVDACIGPIHYTPNDGYSLFITEHDFCGGWARFSGIGVGETVSIPGYGTYTVTARGQVPNPGTTNDVIAVFGGFPRAVLQTCIPGTSQMLLVALN